MDPLQETSVSQLVAELRSGSEEAFSRLYQQFGPKIIRTAKRMLLSQEDAEELSQEIFLIIWNNRKNLRPELSFNAYLLTILKSRLYRKAKSDARRMAYEKYAIYHLEGEESSTENQVLYDELEALSHQAIAQLPKQQKEIFLMRSKDNITSGEIAEILGLSKRTVENHFYQASKTLKAEIQKNYWVPLKYISTIAGVIGWIYR